MSPQRTRSKAGRRAGNPDTRAALIAAGHRRFASQGYSETTVRQIAADVGVDPALINYFFGGKRGLFAAGLALKINPADVVERVLAGPRDGGGKRLLAGLLETWDAPEYGDPLRQLLRAAAGDEQLAEMLRGFAAQELLDQIRIWLGDETLLRAAAIATQLLGLIYARYLLCLEPVASAAPAELVEQLAPGLQLLIDGP